MTHTPEQAIRQAYARITGGEAGVEVSLTDIRRDPHVAMHPRAAVDQALRHISRQPGCCLWPQPFQGTLTPADRAAAVHHGGQDKHLLVIS